LREFKDETYIAEIERLFRRINYIIFRKGRNVLSDFGITPPQFSTLSTVSYHDGITMGELCDHLFLTSATVTALVEVIRPIPTCIFDSHYCSSKAV
jgi:5'-methylthioadenosine phosphorylase